ncbi:MAG TPA: hypothetical protein VF501_03340 [Thiobacillus sp.]
MNLARTSAVLPDTFALHEGELIALQVHTARALDLPDTPVEAGKDRDTKHGRTERPEGLRPPTR